MTEKVRGLVVSVHEVSDDMRYFHIITFEKGNISVGFRGSMKFRGQFRNAVMPLSYSEFVLHTSDGLKYWLNEATLVMSFFGLSSDYDRYLLGSYILNVASYMTVENQADPDLLSLTLNALWLLTNNKDRDMRLIKAAFELRAAAIGGFMPDMSGCRDCGTECRGDCFLSLSDGCLLCVECAKRRRLAEPDGGEFRDMLLPVAAPVLFALKYVCYSEPKKVFAFTLDEEYVGQFARLGEMYLERQLDYHFPTLDMLDLPAPDKEKDAK